MDKREKFLLLLILIMLTFGIIRSYSLVKAEHNNPDEDCGDASFCDPSKHNVQ